MNPMLIEKYDFEVFSPPCDLGTERFVAKAHFDVEITEMIHCLNAIQLQSENA